MIARASNEARSSPSDNASVPGSLSEHIETTGALAQATRYLPIFQSIIAESALPSNKEASAQPTKRESSNDAAARSGCSVAVLYQ